MESRDFVIKIEKEQMATFATYLTGLLKEAAQPQQESKPAAPELTEGQIELLAITKELENIWNRFSPYNYQYESQFLTDAEAGIHEVIENIKNEVYKENK